MIHFDALDLAGFFSKPPEPQSASEKEFFEAPIFVKESNGVTVQVSISFNRDDLCLDISRTGEDESWLKYYLVEIESARIETDINNRQWLRVNSGSSEIAISVEPDISIEIRQI